MNSPSPASQPLPTYEDWCRDVEKTFAPNLEGKQPHPGWQRISTSFPEGFSLPPLGVDPGETHEPILGGREFKRIGGWEIAQRIASTTAGTIEEQISEETQNEVDVIELVIADEAGSRDGLPTAGFNDREIPWAALRSTATSPFTLSIDAGEKCLGLATRAFQALDSVELSYDPVGLALLEGVGPRSELRRASWRGLAELFSSTAGDGRIQDVRTLMRLSTGVVHEAGGHRAHELGVLLAGTLETLKELDQHGISAADALAGLRFDLRIGPDLYAELSKVRAWHQVWALLRAEVGCADATVPIDASLSRRHLTRDDVWVNALRASAATAAAALGGVDRWTLLPIDAVWGGASARSQRIARNLHHVFQRESHLAQVIDPAAGSFSLEALTSELAEAGWKVFQQIESAGGLSAVVESGWLDEEVARERKSTEDQIAKRRMPLTGISEFALGRDPQPFGDLPRPLASPEPNDALSARRLSTPFERRVDRVAALPAERRQVYIARLGSLARSGPRSTFTENALAAADIRVVSGDASNDPLTHSKQLTASGATVAILCGADEDAAEAGPLIATALRQAGARAVWRAGRITDSEDYADSLAGTLVLGQDLLSFLDAVIDQLKANGAAQ